MKLLLLFLIVGFSVKLFAQLDTVRAFYSNGNSEAVVIYEKNISQSESLFCWENGNLKGKRNC